MRWWKNICRKCCVEAKFSSGLIHRLAQVTRTGRKQRRRNCSAAPDKHHLQQGFLQHFITAALKQWTIVLLDRTNGLYNTQDTLSSGRTRWNTYGCSLPELFGTIMFFLYLHSGQCLQSVYEWEKESTGRISSWFNMTHWSVNQCTTFGKNTDLGVRLREK